MQRLSREINENGKLRLCVFNEVVQNRQLMDDWFSAFSQPLMLRYLNEFPLDLERVLQNIEEEGFILTAFARGDIPSKRRKYK